MIQSSYNGNFPEIIDKYDNAVVGNTTRRYLIPISFQQMIEYHKDACRCETCISENSLHTYFLLWRGRVMVNKI